MHSSWHYRHSTLLPSVYSGTSRHQLLLIIRTLVLVFTTARIGYVAPIQGVSQQEATRLVVLTLL